jgi:hypothetical protein
VLGPLAVHLQSDRTSPSIRRFAGLSRCEHRRTGVDHSARRLAGMSPERALPPPIGRKRNAGRSGTRHPHGNVAFRNARCARRSLLIPSLPPRPTIPLPQGRRAPPWGDCIRSRARGPGHRPLSARSVARIVVPSPPLAALGPSQGYQGRGRKPCAKRSHYCLQRCVYIQQ